MEETVDGCVSADDDDDAPAKKKRKKEKGQLNKNKSKGKKLEGGFRMEPDGRNVVVCRKKNYIVPLLYIHWRARQFHPT